MKAIERLKQYIDYKGFTNSSFEKKNELSNGYIATQLKRNADLGEGVLIKILDNCLDLNPLWLLTGKGSMLKNEHKGGISQNISGSGNIQSGNDTITGNDKESIQKLKKELQECKKILKEKEKEIIEKDKKLDKKDQTINNLVNLMSAK